VFSKDGKESKFLKNYRQSIFKNKAHEKNHILRRNYFTF
jgi:hypothetical protein